MRAALLLVLLGLLLLVSRELLRWIYWGGKQTDSPQHLPPLADFRRSSALSERKAASPALVELTQLPASFLATAGQRLRFIVHRTGRAAAQLAQSRSKTTRSTRHGNKQTVSSSQQPAPLDGPVIEFRLSNHGLCLAGACRHLYSTVAEVTALRNGSFLVEVTVPLRANEALQLVGYRLFEHSDGMTDAWCEYASELPPKLPKNGDDTALANPAPLRVVCLSRTAVGFYPYERVPFSLSNVTVTSTAAAAPPEPPACTLVHASDLRGYWQGYNYVCERCTLPFGFRLHPANATFVFWGDSTVRAFYLMMCDLLRGVDVEIHPNVSGPLDHLAPVWPKIFPWSKQKPCRHCTHSRRYHLLFLDWYLTAPSVAPPLGAYLPLLQAWLDQRIKTVPRDVIAESPQGAAAQNSASGKTYVFFCPGSHAGPLNRSAALAAAEGHAAFFARRVRDAGIGHPLGLSSQAVNPPFPGQYSSHASFHSNVRTRMRNAALTAAFSTRRLPVIDLFNATLAWLIDRADSTRVNRDGIHTSGRVVQQLLQILMHFAAEQ
eukprot:TRINITY_DN11285_c0_g1_i1.p1 TRINITY_DN11285_c0_g1~~TRINITY_DN11285_c0_g1_i1.p1  ORF type:complete len:581 (+),score=67.51 TRINITY_DN11285_c0_g1_i1:103-1743(+)